MGPGFHQAVLVSLSPALSPVRWLLLPCGLAAAPLSVCSLLGFVDSWVKPPCLTAYRAVMRTSSICDGSPCCPAALVISHRIINCPEIQCPGTAHTRCLSVFSSGARAWGGCTSGCLRRVPRRAQSNCSHRKAGLGREGLRAVSWRTHCPHGSLCRATPNTRRLLPRNKASSRDGAVTPFAAHSEVMSATSSYSGVPWVERGCML